MNTRLADRQAHGLNLDRKTEDPETAFVGDAPRPFQTLWNRLKNSIKLTSFGAESHGGGLVAKTLPSDEPAANSRTSQRRLKPSASHESPAEAAPQRLRILLVDDHVDTRFTLVRLLQRMGHDVVPAGSVREALACAAVEIERAGLDLLISDLGLPDGSGMEIMRKLSSSHGLPGIALSGYSLKGDVAESAAAGFSAHLIKPIDIAELRAKVTEIGGGGANPRTK